MRKATALLDRAVALSPDRPLSSSGVRVGSPEGRGEEKVTTSLRAAKLKRSASELLEQLNRSMQEAM